jgi:carbon storage regulator
MLVLSRRRGEQIVLPSCEVAITVLAVKGGQVRLGISAPPALAVHRQEVLRPDRAQTRHSRAKKQRMPAS